MGATHLSNGFGCVCHERWSLGRAGVDRGVTGRAGVTGRVMGGCLWAAGGLLRQVCWGRLVA
jgi:hypothetical protein